MGYKLDLIKFNDSCGHIVMDLNEWWTEVCSGNITNLDTYAKQIDEFRKRLKMLRMRGVIKLEEVKDK